MIQVRGTGPEGATLAYTRRYSSQVGDILAKVPEIESTLIINGSPRCRAFIAIGRLDGLGRPHALAAADRRRDRPEAAPHPGRAGLRQQSAARSAQRGSSRPIEFVIQTSGTYEQLQEYVDLMLERIRAYPGLESVDTDLKLNMPEFRIEHRPRQGRRPRPRRHRGRAHARDAARRPAGHALRAERRAVRRLRPARRRGPRLAARRCRRSSCARRRAR